MYVSYFGCICMKHLKLFKVGIFIEKYEYYLKNYKFKYFNNVGIYYIKLGISNIFISLIIISKS